jgi:hypothetical protein
MIINLFFLIRLFAIILYLPCVCLWQRVQQEELDRADRVQARATVRRQKILTDLFLAKETLRDYQVVEHIFDP